MKKHEKEKTDLNGCVYNFFVNYKTFDTSDTLDIRKHLMKKKYNIK